MSAKELLTYIDVREKALHSYEKCASSNDNESAKSELRAAEARWRCEYAVSVLDGSPEQLISTYRPGAKEDLQFLEDLHWQVARNGPKCITPWMSTVITVDESGTPKFTDYLRQQIQSLNDIYINILLDNEKNELACPDAINQYRNLAIFAEKYGIRVASYKEIENLRNLHHQPLHHQNYDFHRGNENH